MKLRVATRASIASGVILGVFVATSTSRFAETVAIVSTVGMGMGWALNAKISFTFGLSALAAGTLTWCAIYLLADDRCAQQAEKPVANVAEFRRRKERRRYA